MPVAGEVVRAFLRAMFDPALPPEAATRFLSPAVRFVERPNAFLPDGRSGSMEGVVPGILAGRRMFVRQRFTIEQLVCEGDQVAVRALWEGHTQPGEGQPATTLRSHSALFFTVRDGLIVEEITHDCFEPRQPA